MLFNVSKWKMMPIRYHNPRESYVMNGVVLETVDAERDKGAIHDQYL